jgi:hypothetical protein
VFYHRTIALASELGDGVFTSVFDEAMGAEILGIVETRFRGAWAVYFCGTG